MHGTIRPRRIGVVHGRGLWTFYRHGLLRLLRLGGETLIGPVLTALLFLVVFAIALGDTQRLEAGVTFQQFLVPGVAMFTLIHSAFSMAAFPLVYDKLEGIIQDLLMSPLAAFETAAGYILIGATWGLATGVATVLAAWAFVPLPMAAPGALLGFAVAAAVLFGAIGVVAGLWAEKWDQLSVADTFLMLPLAFLSGAFFTLDSVPELGRQLIALNPVFYAIDGARFGVLGISQAPPLLAAGIVLLLDAAAVILVWRLFARGYKLKP